MKTLSEVVLAHRQKKGWSQNELASRAKIAPAALSRILSGERAVRMEHLLALAEVLTVTVHELVVDTDASDAVEDWISRERFQASEKARVAAQRAVEIARADLYARSAEVFSLKKGLEDVTRRLQAAEEGLAHSRADADRAGELSDEVARLSRELGEVTAERDRFDAKVNALERARDRALAMANKYYEAWEEISSAVGRVKKDLLLHGRKTVSVGHVIALLEELKERSRVSAPSAGPGARRSSPRDPVGEKASRGLSRG